MTEFAAIFSVKISNSVYLIKASSLISHTTLRVLFGLQCSWRHTIALMSDAGGHFASKIILGLC